MERNEKVNKVDLHIKKELDDTDDREELNKAFVKDAETPIKKENVDEESVNKTYPLKMPGNLCMFFNLCGIFFCTRFIPTKNDQQMFFLF